MVSSVITAKKMPWLVATGALALLLVACGGGDDDDADSAATFGAQSVTCEGMFSDTHRYVTTVHYKIDAPPTPTPEGVPPAPPATEITQSVAADVENQTEYQALYTYQDEFNLSDSSFIRVGDKFWHELGGGWVEAAADVPHSAISVCEALGADIDPVSTSHTSESVNDIASEKFDYADWDTDWAVRYAYFGGGSDVGSLVQTWSGSVWIANDGNYISKMQLTGQGTYADGAVIHVDVSYEIKDRGADINIEPPV